MFNHQWTTDSNLNRLNEEQIVGSRREIDFCFLCHHIASFIIECIHSFIRLIYFIFRINQLVRRDDLTYTHLAEFIRRISKLVRRI